MDIITLPAKEDAPISSLINQIWEYLFLQTMAHTALSNTLIFDTVLDIKLSHDLS